MKAMNRKRQEKEQSRWEGKEGQAAMEFLMTYGWAILAAIIAIGVLALFGVFSPDQYLSSQMLVSPPFYVKAANVQVNTEDNTGEVNLELRNNGVDILLIESIEISDCGIYNDPITASAGSTNVFVIPCNELPNAGKRFKGDVTIKYRKSGSQVDLTSLGVIADKVIPEISSSEEGCIDQCSISQCTTEGGTDYYSCELNPENL